MDAFAQLGLTDWTKDFGLGRAINTVTNDPDRADYYRQEKGDKLLCEFLNYADASVKKATLDYYDLPADTLDFIEWVFNNVAYKDAPKQGRKSRGDDMDIMPYAALYHIFQQRAAINTEGFGNNVQVFRNGRILDPAGNVLKK